MTSVQISKHMKNPGRTACCDACLPASLDRKTLRNVFHLHQRDAVASFTRPKVDLSLASQGGAAGSIQQHQCSSKALCSTGDETSPSHRKAPRWALDPLGRKYRALGSAGPGDNRISRSSSKRPSGHSSPKSLGPVLIQGIQWASEGKCDASSTS